MKRELLTLMVGKAVYDAKISPDPKKKFGELIAGPEFSGLNRDKLMEYFDRYMNSESNARKI